MSRRRVALLGAVLTVAVLVSLVAGISRAEPEPPQIVLSSGGQERYGVLNNNQWCPLLVPVRCTGFIREALEYPHEPLRVESGSEMVFKLGTWSIPLRFHAPDYGRNPTGGSQDFAPSRRAVVAAPSEPGDYEIHAGADFLQGFVSRGFYVVVEPVE